MAERVQKKKQTVEKEATAEEEVSAESRQEAHDKRMRELDEVLDNIDEVLEEEAETFIREFVQKGGQMANITDRLRAILAPWITGSDNTTIRLLF